LSTQNLGKFGKKLFKGIWLEISSFSLFSALGHYLFQARQFQFVQSCVFESICRIASRMISLALL